jgi:hypothetical protein
MTYFFAQDAEESPYGVARAACKRGDYYETAYKWLSQYCDFFPPLFISTDQSRLSGYNQSTGKVLFGFSNVRGYPVKYDEWMRIVEVLINIDTTDFSIMDRAIIDGLKDMEKVGDIDLSTYPSFEAYLKKAVFVESEQYVVNSLDLRKASVIVCQSEIHKSSLIRKGFPASLIRIASMYSRFGGS